MNFKKALLPFTIYSLLLAVSAADEEAAAQVESISVTGSRIKRVDMEVVEIVIVLNDADLIA